MEVESLSVTVGAIHTRLEALVKDNLESSNQMGRGKGSSTYQTRQNVTGALLNKLEKRRKEIFDLEERVISDGREIIRRRYDDSSPSLHLTFLFLPSSWSRWLKERRTQPVQPWHVDL